MVWTGLKDFREILNFYFPVGRPRQPPEDLKTEDGFPPSDRSGSHSSSTVSIFGSLFWETPRETLTIDPTRKPVGEDRFRYRRSEDTSVGERRTDPVPVEHALLTGLESGGCKEIIGDERPLVVPVVVSTTVPVRHVSLSRKPRSGH